MKFYDWNPDNTAVLKALAAKSLSASQIATALVEQFGEPVTRNMVISRARRVGAQLGGPARRAPISRPKTLLTQRAAPRGVVALPEIDAPEGVDFETESGPGAFDAIQALTSTTCRWPIGDPQKANFRFCMAETSVTSVTSVYCTHHALIARDPIRSRPKGLRDRPAASR